MNPSVTHFKPKLLSTWKPYFLYLSTSFQRKWGMNVAVFTQGNISIKPKSLGGQRSQVKKIWGYTGLNMRESDKWYVTCYSVRSGSMSCLCMSSCCSTFVILFCWCSNLSQSVQLCGWMDGWMLHHKIVTEEKVLKTLFVVCESNIELSGLRYRGPKVRFFLEGVRVSR